MRRFQNQIVLTKRQLKKIPGLIVLAKCQRKRRIKQKQEPIVLTKRQIKEIQVRIVLTKCKQKMKTLRNVLAFCQPMEKQVPFVLTNRQAKQR